ncbi:MAG: transporter substrate-binding domain-containing protein [Oscillospiraceae bacterium]|nr:transporter substrate-binding domain-containing protein [Oscillospiraceae bacterium]
MKHSVKKIIAAVLVCIMVLSLAACGGSKSSNVKTGTTSTYAYLVDTTNLVKPQLDLSNADGALKTILDRGVLIIATSPDYPPAEFIDATDGKIYGSEMILAKYVADCLGVDLQIEAMDFNSCLTAVDTGKVDVSFSGFGWKADREEAYELSVGYEGGDDINYHTLICLAEDAEKYKSLEDMVGAHIIAQASSLQQMYVEDQIVALEGGSATNLELVSTLDQAILSLQSKKCDLLAMDGSTAQKYVAESNGMFVETGVHFDLTMYGTHEGNVCAAKKGETSLIEAVNECLKAAMDNGYYPQWYAEAKALAGITDEE